MRQEARAALAAASFLTRVPVGRDRAFEVEDLRRAAAYFPAVGAAVGGGVGALAVRLAARLPTPLAVALSLAAGTAVTGALHLDALADSADAVGAHGRERALEVMRDPRLGSFGAAALALDLLVKSAALAALAERSDAVGVAGAAGALSRAVPVALAAALPYARTGEGTGLAITGTSRGRAAAAGGLALAATAIGARGAGVRLATVAASVVLACGLVCQRWLGGVTGDTLGASLELSETAVLVAAVAFGGRPAAVALGGRP